MTSIADDLAEALTTVRQPGTFYVAGTESMFAPGLAVQGVGPIALPLLPVQAEQLIAAAERAPYGRGAETLTDIGVRRTWQIAPQRVKVTGRHWPATLQSIVSRVAEGLGIADTIEADLYKLLIYDEGSFFVPHRDTEKASGMFATLILALPSVSQGGELIVRHKDREARLTLHPDDPSDLAFAAFYADCVHEVRPVTAGHRLVLVYNLIRRGAGRLLTAADHTTQEDEVAAILEQWAASPREPDDPEKLIYLLEHAYTPAELSFDSLKGADSGIAQVVAAAAQRAGCDVHLALIVIEENGSAEYTGDYRRGRRGRYDDDDDDDEEEFEVIEVNDQYATAANWRRPDFQPSPLTELPIEEAEFSPPLSFEELEPDEQHFHEATGNAGASFERTYRRTALILWPANRILAVINQGGPSVTLPFLADLVERWETTGDPSLNAQAGELADHMLSDWPASQWHPSPGNAPSGTGQFLDLLRRLNDIPRLQTLLTTIANCNGFDHGDAASIAAALLALPPNQTSTLAARLIEQAPETALASSANLLVHLSAANPTLATPAARILVAALPGEPKPPSWHRNPITPHLIADLFTALGRIDPTLAAISADHILDWPASYDFDTILIPAMHILLDSPDAAVQRLRAACTNHLDTRIALPLQPPVDWRRDNKLGCTCKDCQALAAYLDDPAQKTWVFAAAEPRRRHVEETIRTAKSDVDTATEKRGSPHRLICTKNQGSYQRRCEQRTNDLANREQLRS